MSDAFARNGDDRRDPAVVLRESIGFLALVATRRLYDEQPDLWRLGENGRARTHEDFTHHLTALADLSGDTFRHHVDYCERLFAQRGFPAAWLADAWRILDTVLDEELPGSVSEPARRLLHAVTSRPPAEA